MMTTARFQGGPLDGRELQIPAEKPPLEIHVSSAVRDEIHGEILDVGGFARYVIGDEPHVRYVKHFERRGVAHYYIPTS